MKRSRLLLALLLAFSLSPQADNINLVPTGVGGGVHVKISKNNSNTNSSTMRDAAGQYRFLINPAAPSQMIGFCEAPYEWDNAAYQINHINPSEFFASGAADSASLQELFNHADDQLAMLQSAFQNNSNPLTFNNQALPYNNLQMLNAVNTFSAASGNSIAPLTLNLPSFGSGGGGTQNFLPAAPATVPVPAPLPLMASILVVFAVIRRRVQHAF